MKTLKNSTIKTPSGLTLSCAAQGNPKAPAVILLHGYSDSWRSYAPLIAELSQKRRVIAVTMRGHGDSEKPEAGYGISDFAGDLPHVMDQFNVASATVVGHSMGSMVAARLALSHPNRVYALVFIGAIATLKGNAEVEGPLCEAVETLADPISTDFVREFQESTLARAVTPDFLSSIVAESIKVPARVWRDALHGMLEDDLGPELRGISVPTLMLWGDQDGICDRVSQTKMADAIPDAKLSILPGAGHAPHWEDPQGVATAIVSFLETDKAAA